MHCLYEVEHSCVFNHIYHVMLNFNYISPSDQFTILIDSHNGDYEISKIVCHCVVDLCS